MSQCVKSAINSHHLTVQRYALYGPVQMEECRHTCLCITIFTPSPNHISNNHSLNHYFKLFISQHTCGLLRPWMQLKVPDAAGTPSLALSAPTIIQICRCGTHGGTLPPSHTVAQSRDHIGTLRGQGHALLRLVCCDPLVWESLPLLHCPLTDE